MFMSKTQLFSILLLFVLTVGNVAGQNNADKNQQTLQKSISLIRKYFFENENWKVSTPSMEQDVEGLINFIENEPIDSLLNNLDESLIKIQNYVIRFPENVSDSLNVLGFYSYNSVKVDVEKISVQLQKKFQETEITVPEYLLANIDKKVKTIEPGNGIRLFADSIFIMPDSLKIPDVIPDSVLNDPNGFRKLVKIDSIRNKYIEFKRLEYNNSLLSNYRDSVIQEYRKNKFEGELVAKTKQLVDSVKINNAQVLRDYNNEVMKSVNDSIQFVLLTLSAYADYIDSTQVSIINLQDETTDILLQNGNGQFAKIWLKNQQNDSVSVLIKSIDKRSIQLLIDDGVTFSRFKQKETKEFDFSTLNERMVGIDNVGNLYQPHTPWLIGGDGTVGFTQTYLENWKKGGKSALSLLMVLKGFANFSSENNKIKWESSGEIRNGWISQSGEGAELQKNDDKFELTTRFGVSAFKKWYYSTELNYNTQFFNGYRYPTSSNPVPFSSFMAPARTFFKLGLDYKPNKDFSLFLSPLTIKNVFVKDTVKIDQTKFGISANKKSFWEPGLNADITFKKEITKDIIYETKYKMFINYKEPFKKFDINWENLLIMQLTDYIDMRMMVHFIYDDDVLFPVYDDSNMVIIGEKAKLQIKELITVGFSYRINHKVVTTKRIR